MRQKQPPPRPPQRPLPTAPRRVLNIAVIAGGLIGIILSYAFNWDAVQGFLFTLLIAGGLALIVGLVYGALNRGR